MFIICYLILGCVVGLLSGLLGIGGGIIVVPSLVVLLSYQHISGELLMQVSAGTSLAAMVLTTLRGVLSRYRLHTGFFSLFLKISPGLIVGILIGCYLSHVLHSHVLKIIFAVLMMVMSIQLLFYQQKDSGDVQGVSVMLSSVVLSIFGAAVGTMSSLLGVGGSFLVTPYLLYQGVSIRIAITISILIGLTVALLSTVSYVYWGWHVPGLPRWSVGYVDWPVSLIISISSLIFVPLGVKLSERFSRKRLQHLFAILLFFVGLHMMIL